MRAALASAAALAAIVATAALSSPTARAEASASLLDEALSSASFHSSMETARVALETSLKERGPEILAKIGKERFDRVNRALLAVVTADALFARFRQDLRPLADDASLQEVIAWHHSPLGKKIDEAGSVRKMAIEKRQIEAYMTAVKGGKVLTEPRMKLVADIVEKRRAGETSAALEVAVGQCMAIALNETYPPGGKQDELAMAQGFAALERELGTQQKDNVLLGFLAAYRDLSDAELSKYRAFLAKPAVARFHAAVIDALRRSLDALGHQAGALANRG